jgi:hypothetical protein
MGYSKCRPRLRLVFLFLKRLNKENEEEICQERDYRSPHYLLEEAIP